jgi:hypothetical protein
MSLDLGVSLSETFWIFLSAAVTSRVFLRYDFAATTAERGEQFSR